MGWDWYPKPARRRLVANGIKAKTGRGQKFGQTWWAGKWLAALEKLVDPGRLSRGRSYARSGQVLNLDIQAGRVEARVQGSEVRPYTVRIEVTPLSDQAWDKVTAAMAAQAIFAAKLLAGEMPPNIEEAFAAAGASLFPERVQDLQTDCSCPDWANPCKHTSAVYYLLGEQFDDDPFLLFGLRGRSKNQIIAALRALRTGPERPSATRAKRQPRRPAAEPAAERVVPLSQSLESFWTAGDALETLRFTLSAPDVEAAAVKQLGEPPFWSGTPSFVSEMSQAYGAVTRAALALALGHGAAPAPAAPRQRSPKRTERQ
jgi:uncharacterized Zn finger protein